MSEDSNSKNRIELDKNAGNLNLRDRPAGRSAAGKGTPQSQPQKTAPGKGRGERSGVSKISEMASESHHLPTNLGANQPAAHVMSDNYIERRRWIRWGVSVTLVVGFVAGMIWSPEFSRLVKANAHDVVSKVKGLLDEEPKLSAKKRTRKKASPRTRLPRQVERPQTSKPKEKFFVDPSCSLIVKTPLGVTDYQRMNRVEKVLVAECFLLYGQVTSAEATVSDFPALLSRIGESKINQDISPGGLGDALFTLIDVYLAKTDYRAADALLTRHCRAWRRSNSCVGKLTTLVARKFTDAAESAYRQMVIKGEKINKSAFARYHLAGAQIASLKGQSVSAAKRFRQALSDAPKKSYWLRKRIYESYGVQLYRRDEILELKKLMTTALSEFRGVDPNAKVKLLLLSDIANPSSRRGAVEKFLFDTAKAYQARGDLEMIEILGAESIRFGHETLFLKLLKRAKTFFSSQYRASKQIMRELQAWEIRARFSLREYEFVFQSLGRYENEFGKDVFSAHLRGIAYMGFSPNKQYQLLAAQEIQESLRKEVSWEGLYALGTAFVRGGKFREAVPVMKDLAQKAKVPKQRYWLEMLQAEYYIAGRNHAEAVKILQRWRAREPSFRTPVELLIVAYRGLNRPDLAQKAELVLDAMRARVKRSQTSEGRSSPLGPMALAPRALD